MEKIDNIDESENNNESIIKSDKDNESKNKSDKDNNLLLEFKIRLPWTNRNNLFFLILIIVMTITLPFHYIIQDGKLKVVTKDNFTLSNTLVTQHDIDKIITRYNDKNGIEKMEMEKESVLKKLLENDFVVFKKPSEDDREKMKSNKWEYGER